LDPRLVARVLLLLIAIAALVGGWIAIQPPDDLTRLPSEPTGLRLGPRAATAAQRCREALGREHPLLDDNSIVVLGVALVPGDRDPGSLSVDGSFREADTAGATRHRSFRCTLDSAGLRSLEVRAPED
jgi:hypothetical protein